MKRIAILFTPVLCLFTVTSALRASPTIFGEYVEARTCDVWTGPCFSNSEINTSGELAVIGWVVHQGSWDGQDLAGLKIAAAIRAEGTLCTENEGKLKAVVYIDEKASEDQVEALLSMARTLAGKYLEKVIDVRRGEIRFERDHEEAVFEIPSILKIKTVALNSCCNDRHCGNEEIAYPSLSKNSEFTCAKTIEHYFKADGLKAIWSDPFKRSAMVGEFSL